MPEMKDSGIEWIGEIPEECQTVRLKFGTYMKGRIGWQGLKSCDFIDDGPYCITSTDFAGGHVIWERCYHVSEERYAMDPFIQVKSGDILISKDGTIGKLAIIDNLPGKACLNSHLLLIRPANHYTTKYLFYVLSSDIFVYYYSLVGSGSTMQSLSQEKMGEFSFPIWSIPKQEVIASFLDSKCAEIDALIADIEKEIALLEEYKKSVITEAVTKGLDPSVEMKDSGIEWCPQIPLHWYHTNPKALFSQRFERALKGDKQLTASQEHGIVYQDDFMEMTGARVVTVMKDFSILKHVEPGDFVISMRSFQGGLEYSELRGCISSAYVMLIPNEEMVYPPFYKWFFKSFKYINAIQSTSNLVRDGQAMRYANFVQVPLFIIPKEEQREIAEYLDERIAKIDEVKKEKQDQLILLADYKKSLIYEYVTGKKEV